MHIALLVSSLLAPLVPKEHYQSVCIAIKQLGFEYCSASQCKMQNISIFSFGESNKNYEDNIYELRKLGHIVNSVTQQSGRRGRAEQT
jgi:hypothetical protein